jgi:ABC-type transport system substrate-binding protein
VVQGDLAQAGIKMNIENLASDAYIQDWLKGDFQGAFAWNSADPDPYTMYGRYFGTGANLGVPAGYSSPQLQKLLTEGDVATSLASRKMLWTPALQHFDVERSLDLAVHRIRLRSGGIVGARVLIAPRPTRPPSTA